MKIQIHQIAILNFKGIKQLFVNFNQNTSIFGANGTGKTTIYDAFCWLLFGKNSEDRKDFNVKNTVDLSLNRQDHEVSATIVFDGVKCDIKRVYKEKWVKKKGSEESEYSGNETTFYWNEVPMRQQDFQEKISQILNENTFKLLTNPLYFNSLKWQDRRSILTSLAGEVSNYDIAVINSEYKDLVELLSTKTIDEIKRELAAKKKGIKSDLDQIPPRIDELLRSISGDSFLGIDESLQKKQLELKVVEDAINDVLKQKQQNQSLVIAKNEELFKLKLKLNTAKSEFNTSELKKSQDNQQKVLSAQNSIKSSKDLIYTLTENNEDFGKNIEKSKSKIQELKKKWYEVSDGELYFDESKFSCPTCKRPHDSDNVEAMKIEMIENFNQEKAKEIDRINNEGLSEKRKIAEYQEQINKNLELINEYKNSIVGMQAFIVANSQKQEDGQSFESTQEFISISAEIEAKEFEIKEMLSKSDVDISSENVSRKAEIEKDIDTLKALIAKRENEKATQKRIEQLKAEEKEKAQMLSNLERQENKVQGFVKAKIQLIEETINQKFNGVTFKMFETQVNGGESEICETQVNGVPWTDANTGSKIAAGLEIINVLSNFYGASAPIFLDNRESTTNIPVTGSQTINLFVSADDKVLRVA